MTRIHRRAAALIAFACTAIRCDHVGAQTHLIVEHSVVSIPFSDFRITPKDVYTDVGRIRASALPCDAVERPCVAEALQRAHASRRVVTIAQTLDGAFFTSIVPDGAIEIGTSVDLFAANSNRQTWLILPGSLIHVDVSPDDLRQIFAPGSPFAAQLPASMHPADILSRADPAGYLGIRALAGGETLALFRETLVDTCRACALAGTVTIGYRLDAHYAPIDKEIVAYDPPGSATTMDTTPAHVDLAAARALVRRVTGKRASAFRVAALAQVNDSDVFEVDHEGRTIVLRGSSGVAIASALDWYLEHIAGINIASPSTGAGSISARLKPHLALPATRIRKVSPYRVRYFFNYCTFSYSMAWWNWDDWQRMIDWMALKGINTPLAVTGQEGVWQLVLRDMGFSDAQISAFLVGPAYLPWSWMGNIDGLGGPLPASWISSHVALERRILARERSLGMTPVLQGFTGHVPESIRTAFPGAQIHQTGDWSAGFRGTWFLDPLDPLFARMGKDFIRRQSELFGTDHLYAADPFNEINPPSNDSAFVSHVSRAIYDAMHDADSEATWALQGWFLYYQANFWREPQARGFLGAVPDDHLLVLDLWGDAHPVWKTRDAFYGKPWIWNVLYNFGGKVSVNGNLPAIAKNLEDALTSPDRGKLTGLGMTMEGLGTNPIVPDFVMDQVWRDSVPDLTDWTHEYIINRYGAVNDAAWSAWKILLSTAFTSSAQTGTFLAERPGFYRKGVAYRSEPNPPYDEAKLVEALDSLLAAAPALGESDAYQYDLVNLERQVLGQLGLPLVDSIEDAATRRDIVTLQAKEARVVDLLDDLDRLTGTRSEFLLGKWIADAKRWATSDSERRLYEWNARNIITMWGTECTEGQNDDLNLYAYKEWNGIFSGYFLPRWKAFFTALNRSVDRGVPFDRKPYAAEMCQWEKRWSHGTEKYPATPHGDPIAVARELATKWRI